MKKYRLKKDMPGYKAGEMFEMRHGVLFGMDDVAVYDSSQLHERPDIMDWFEEVGKMWVPGENKDYWGIGENGEAYCFVNRYQGITNKNIAIGNCFCTKEEAEAHLKWLKAVAVLRTDTAGQRPRWGEGATNWVVSYDYFYKRLRSVPCSNDVISPFIFDDKVDTNRSIDEHKAEWLTFLGVE